MGGQEFTFTIKRGVGNDTCVSVNYDDFVNDVEVGDILLVDGMLSDSLSCLSFHILCCLLSPSENLVCRVIF